MVQREEIRADFSQRLKKALAQRDIAEWGAGARLAKVTGKTAKAASKWLNEETMPGRDSMVAIAEWLNVRVEWLAHGDGGMTESPKPESNAVMIGMMSAWDSDTPLHDDEVAIPFYKEVEMAAGSGATEVVEVPGRLLRFAKSTLRDAGVAEANAACVQIRGNSMERLIMDGATVGIDRGTTQIIDGEIYAIDHDGMLRIKYLYRMPGGGLRIRSENSEEHPDEILSAEDAARIRVLGWVFWWSTVRRRRGIQR